MLLPFFGSGIIVGCCALFAASILLEFLQAAKKKNHRIEFAA